MEENLYELTRVEWEANDPFNQIRAINTMASSM